MDWTRWDGETKQGPAGSRRRGCETEREDVWVETFADTPVGAETGSIAGHYSSL